MCVINLDETLEKIAALEAASELGKILSHKWHDHISGGLSDRRSPADFPREDLIKGMTVEMEHTNNPSVSCEIAMDHLTEDPHYYDHEQDMAKEVRDKLGHVSPRVDDSIKLAEDFGAQLAGMTKEAIPNPMASIKGLGTHLFSGAAPKSLATGVKSMAHGAGGSMGKVLPMTHPGHVSTGVGFQQAVPHSPAMASVPVGREHALSPTMSSDQFARGSVPSSLPTASGAKSRVTVRPGSAAAPVRPRGMIERPVPVQEAVQNAVGEQGSRVGTQEFTARKAKLMNEPAGSLVGADQLMKNPEALSAYQRAHGLTPVPGKVTPASAQPVRAQAASAGQVASGPATAPQAVAQQAAPVPGWASKIEQDVGPMSGHRPMHPKLQQNLDKLRARDAAVNAVPTSAGPQTGSSFGGRAEAPKSPGKVVSNGEATGTGGPTSGGPGTVAPNAQGPAVKRFGVGKVLGYGALAGAGYGAYKGIPWAANKIDQENSGSLAYNDGYPGGVNFGYGPNRFGEGMPTMGAG